MQAGLRCPGTNDLGTRLVLTACLVVAGCEDAPVPQADTAASVPAVPRWRSVSDGTAPDVWLAGLESGDPGPPPADRVERFRRLLDEASAAYVETPRMVANRLVQAKDTIDATPGLAGSADATIEGLFHRLLFRARDGRQLLFGTVIDHYLNLLRQGLDEATAAERLEAEFRAERLHDVR